METTFLTVGIACLIAAVAGGGLRAFGLEIPVLNSVPRQLLLGILGVAFVAFSIWLIPVKPPKIQITSPIQGAKVDHKEVVSGTISGKLRGRLSYLWGAVTPASGDYQDKEEWWPQSQITPLGEGWNLTFEIGDERKDVGKDKEYMLAVFLLTREAHEKFWSYKNNWNSNDPTPYPLNEFLKSGDVEIVLLVKVVRR
jgi:hypothetical protein